MNEVIFWTMAHFAIGCLNMIKYLLYRLRWKLGLLTHLDIELNNTCNHACIFCWHSEPLNFNLKIMKYDTAIDHLISGRRAGLISVKFNLRGEPTLHPRLVDIVRYAKRLGYVDIMINTHGARLFNFFLPLKAAGITTIIISIGSTDREKYAALHQVDPTEFDHLHAGLALAHAYKGHVRIKLNCHESNISHIEFDWLRKLYPKFKIVRRFMEAREGQDISIPRVKTRKKKCPHLQRRLTIHSNGAIYPCCMSFNAQADIQLGNTIPEALESRKALQSRYANKDFPQSCKSCPSGDVFTFKV